MNSIMLRLTASYLKYVLYLLAVLFFLKGHNTPGGGFIAGLMVASAFILDMLSHSLKDFSKSFKIRPLKIAVFGVLISLFSSILPVFFNQPFFYGLWLPAFDLPLVGTLHLGTPMLFDLGVFLTVLGFSVSIIYDLEKA